jgi:uncharacterized protein (TIRG00374 family)
MKRLKHLLWIPVPLLLYWALKDIRLTDMLRILGRLTPVQAAALLAVNLLFVLILALRWSIILRGLGAPLPLLRLVSYRLAGFSISYLTPGPQFGGEPLQLYLTRRRSGLRYELGSASLLLDKSFELLGNFAFLGLAALAIVPLDLLPARTPGFALALCSILIALPAGYLAAVSLGFQPLSWLADRLPERPFYGRGLHKTKALIRASELRIVAYCRRPARTLLQLLLFFLLVWTVSLVEMRMVLRFLGISADLWESIFVLAGARFAFLLPFPGALGALELTYAGVFELLGHGAETGLSLVLYMRARDLLFAAAGLSVAFVGWARREALSPQGAAVPSSWKDLGIQSRKRGERDKAWNESSSIRTPWISRASPPLWPGTRSSPRRAKRRRPGPSSSAAV